MMQTTVCSFAMALLFVGCTSSDDRPHAGATDYAFEGGLVEQHALERRAKSGDSEAAIRLGRYYEMVMHDYTRALYWFDLSARLGNQRGVYFARTLREALRESRE